MKKNKSLEERARELDRGALDKIGDAVTLNTRNPNFQFAEDTNIRCPLCEEKFEKMIDRVRSSMKKRKVYVLVCHRDKIACLENDPFVGKWESALKGEKIPCPGCNADMRFFCTALPYVKAKCPKKGCGATITSVSPNKELGLTIIPANVPVEMKGPETIQ